jgi:hypothetical protein
LSPFWHLNRGRTSQKLDPRFKGCATPAEHDKVKTILSKLMNFKIWKSPADSEVDRVLSDNKSAVKEWLKRQGLDIGYLLS